MCLGKPGKNRTESGEKRKKRSERETNQRGPKAKNVFVWVSKEKPRGEKGQKPPGIRVGQPEKKIARKAICRDDQKKGFPSSGRVYSSSGGVILRKNVNFPGDAPKFHHGILHVGGRIQKRGEALWGNRSGSWERQLLKLT